jgi:hypothetical protein
MIPKFSNTKLSSCNRMAWSSSGFERTRIRQATSSSESSGRERGGDRRASRKFAA